MRLAEPPEPATCSAVHDATVLHCPAERATDREVGVVAAVLVAGSEKAATHRLGLSHSTVKHHLANARSKVGATTMAQLVWILAPRLPEAVEGSGVGWSGATSSRGSRCQSAGRCSENCPIVRRLSLRTRSTGRRQ